MQFAEGSVITKQKEGDGFQSVASSSAVKLPRTSF